MKLETLALHAGYEGDPTTHAATTPIYQTTSYTFDNTQHGAARTMSPKYWFSIAATAS
ncbi:MAG: PLP-dependent transferase, partial [Gammaproteobacteria bacterium]|nr:PLP-dependent transferase [Gammaproteobacteria bacterium]